MNPLALNRLNTRNTAAGRGSRSMVLLVLVALVAMAWRTAPAHAAVATTDASLQSQGAIAQDDGSNDDGDGDGDGDVLLYRGKIVSFTPPGPGGTWVVGEKTFTTDADTEYETENGPFAVGACVEVKSEVATPTVAEKFSTESSSDDACTGDDDGGGDDDNDGDGDDDDDSDGVDELEFYGRIVSFSPPGPGGTWVVDDKTFTTDADTEYETEHGAFAVGVCVEVESDPATPTLAEKIETESSYKCDGSDDDDDGDDEFEHEFYGKIVTLAAGPAFQGEWKVGDITFTVNASTELKQEGCPFAVGATVKVHFYEDAGAKIAREVETVFCNNDDDDGDDDNDGKDDDGIHEGEDGHAWGPIVAFPAELIGEWDIAGIKYTATDKTEFDDEDDSSPAFAVGVNVKVEYYTDANGNRIATEIEITDERGEVDETDKFKFVGFVISKPAGSYLGTWKIGDVEFVADNSTEFDEEKGLLTEGAYVEVKYQKVGEQLIIREIEVEVPPGAGEDDDFGKIDDMGDDNPTAAAVAVVGKVWSIGGVNYVITAATDLVDAGGVLEVGGSALVNSYRASDGSHVATRVQGFTVVATTWLPMAQR